MGLGPVPHSAILAYAQWMGWADEFDAFLSCIRAMDAAFMEWSSTDPKERRTVAKEPLSPTVFAGMFGKGS
jgi:predicted small integral membrane protein